MFSRINAIVTDIDGTITHRDRKLHLHAVEKIRELKVPVILATGNTVCFTKAAAKLIGTSEMIIAENGGVVLTRFDEEEILNVPQNSLEKCELVYQLLSQYFELEKLDAKMRKSEIAVRRNFDVNKAREILRNSELSSDVELVDSGFAIHIKSKGVNKGLGLKKILETTGLKPSEIAAFGDSENDIEVFRLAGYSIAVANAVPQLKEIASYIAKHEYGEGFIEGVEHLKEMGFI
ncbi:MAG: phosphoglycolate phosphatase [Methanocellales archaeon]